MAISPKWLRHHPLRHREPAQGADRNARRPDQDHRTGPDRASLPNTELSPSEPGQQGAASPRAQLTSQRHGSCNDQFGGAKGIRTPDLLHAIRNRPIARRSHMLPDQQLHWPRVARRRPVSPLACSPLAPRPSGCSPPRTREASACRLDQGTLAAPNASWPPAATARSRLADARRRDPCALSLSSSHRR
jgi:hypothetical protein